MDFQNTKLSLTRPLTSYAKVQALISAFRRNWHFQIDGARLCKKEYLDLGCGPNSHPDFINIDYAWHPGIDICWDITRGIPLDNGSVSGVFTEHCLEHILWEKTDFVLGECFRILRPNGTLRIIVPDGELYLAGYTDLMRKQTDVALPYAAEDVYKNLYSPIMSVNRIFRAHGHLFIYDFYSLRLLLEKNGFIEIKKESYLSGRDSKLLVDTQSRKVESLYVECSKPRP